MQSLSSALDRPAMDPSQSLMAAVFLGAEGVQRKALKRLMLMLIAYAGVLTLLVFMWASRMVPSWKVELLGGYIVLGLLGFYAVLRSGYSVQFEDPTITFPQVVFNIGTVVLGYTLIEASQGLALQWLCVLMVFDMPRLTRRQLLVSVAGTVIALFLATMASWAWNPHAVSLERQMVNLVMASAMLPVLLIVIRVSQHVRKQRKAQRAQLQQTLEQLNILAIHDGLTELFNRRHIMDVLQQEVLRVRRSGRSFCVAILDIDHFKAINDEHGHGVGDAVLKEFSRVVREVTDGRYAAARWGGEEFLVLMPDASLQEGESVLNRLLDAVRSHDWSAILAARSVTFSAGLCAHSGGMELTQSLEAADKALYQAKNKGRNQVMVAPQGLQ